VGVILLGSLSVLTVWAGVKAVHAVRLHHAAKRNAALQGSLVDQRVQLDSLLVGAERFQDRLAFAEAFVGIIDAQDHFASLDSLKMALQGSPTPAQLVGITGELDSLLVTLRRRAARVDSSFLSKRTLLTHLPTGLPVEGRLTSRFGRRRNPFEKGGPKTDMHEGVDLARPEGAPVYTTAAGVVLYAGWAKGYGNLVILDHQNGFYTYYAHNSVLKVEEGQHVDRGEVIALVGSTGRSTSPHLHYEVRRGRQAENPLEYKGVC
jgi:murein DD-endopeptidase MepM/ murein hydrolase activator NlpD